jgi:hypothetical protein
MKICGNKCFCRESSRPQGKGTTMRPRKDYIMATVTRDQGLGGQFAFIAYQPRR